MPYTPPSHQQSPASSKSASPAISRSSSYSEHDSHLPRSPGAGRSQPPRSHSSSSYLHKHRRSPSFQKSDAPPTPTEAPDHANSVHAKDFGNGSVRQSPPPVNNLLIPTGAVISPPDSSENSGDEDGQSQRGRELEKKWDQLQEAVRGIDLKREGSPDKVGMHRRHQPHQQQQQHLQHQHESDSEPVSQATSPSALTPEARKISHSRSSTENAIIIPRQTHFSESPNQTSDSSDEDEDENLSKPSLVRKKSGELVKPALRPSSRRRYSSMPGTPTYSKSVHFNDNGNQTRHFLQVDKPMAVSAGSSPVEQYDSESEYPFDMVKRDIRLANFPADTLDRRMQPVRVERLYLSADRQTLIGNVAVQNISFHKLVVARFTFDYWKTTSEVVAEFDHNIRKPDLDGCDRFSFHIKLSDSANVDDKTLLLCIRYNVGGQEFWDNNDNTNYHIDFTKMAKKKARPAPTGLGARPLNAIPRSRHSPPASRAGRQESIDDDFAARFEPKSDYSFGTPEKFLGDQGGSIKLKPRAKRGNLFASNEEGGGGATAVAKSQNGLGGRYDFGASLSAALTNAQDKLGRQSGLGGEKAQKVAGQGGYFGPLDRKQGPAKVASPAERPDSITTDRPAMGSDQYRDLVQKFCYFTPTAAGKSVSSPSSSQTTVPRSSEQQLPQKQAPTFTLHSSTSAASSGTATVGDDASGTSSATSSGTNTPPAPPHLDGVSDRMSPAYGSRSAGGSTPFVSRSTSPATAQVTAGHSTFGARAASPVSFGYPYHNHGDYLSDSPKLTAIQG